MATVGGARLSEPAVDLAVALAVASAAHDTPLQPGTVALGEVGLAGEVRPVPGVARRLAEAARLGLRRGAGSGGQHRSGPAPAGMLVRRGADVTVTLGRCGTAVAWPVRLQSTGMSLPRHHDAQYDCASQPGPSTDPARDHQHRSSPVARRRPTTPRGRARPWTTTPPRSCCAPPWPPSHRAPAARRPGADPARAHRSADRARLRRHRRGAQHRRVRAGRRVLGHPAARAGEDGRRDRDRPGRLPDPPGGGAAGARLLDRDRASPAPDTAPPSGWPSRPVTR